MKYDHPNGYDPKHSYPWSSDRTLLGWIPNDKTVLELGCATGYMGDFLHRNKRCNVTGIDSDLSAINKFKGSYKALIQGDLDDPTIFNPLNGQKFDIVLAAAVVEHVKSPSNLLRQIKCFMQSSSMLIVSLPNIAHWSIRLQLLGGQFSYNKYGILDDSHLRFFTYFSAQETILEQGFIIDQVSIDPDAGLPIINGIVRRFGGGWYLLNKLYNIWPNLFAYQVLIRACLDRQD